MSKLYFLVYFLLLCDFSHASWEDLEKVTKLLKIWSEKLGRKLYNISTTMTRKINLTKRFQPLEKSIYKENGAEILNNIAFDIREVMDKKVDAVKDIAEYAEFLAYHRDQITESAKNYQFFNAENITDTTANDSTKIELEKYTNRTKCDWWCKQKDLAALKYNSYHTINEKLDNLFKIHRELMLTCDCNNAGKIYNDSEYYNNLPLVYNNKFDTAINLNISVVKVAANVYHRDPKVLEGIQWSDALDMIFRENYSKDKTLLYQYFASPLGYMRHFPAVKWSTEDYDKTYDPRTRSWFTEAITSPKDVIILLDRSGSMTGYKRATASLVVNNILDTLNDNDFVNIYTFTNTSDPLVPCFEDTLVQANEENLRLLREKLTTYRNEFTANVWAGVNKVFNILQKFQNDGSRCNKVIMIVSDEIDYDYQPKNFVQLNGKGNFSVRIFTYEIRTEEFKFAFQTDPAAMRWIACANRGYYVNITFKAEVREDVLIYDNVLSRPVNDNYIQAKNGSKWEAIWSYLQIDLADRRYSNWLWKKVEGNRQREIFLDHIKRQYMRTGQKLTSNSHMLLQENHEYERYKRHIEYDYMTTVSMPVFGRRESDRELIGVAAVDVPVKLLNSKVNHYKLGVNGYAFILTNNGYVLMHPDHRREFQNIPKPTFNRVDFVEVEIMDDLTKPRLFNPLTIVQLREDIVRRDKNKSPIYPTFRVKYTVDNMKRILHGERTYFYTAIGPFNLGVALPDKYGLMVVRHQRLDEADFERSKNSLMKTKNWEVHPDWVYCKDSDESDEHKGRNPKEVVLNCLDSENSNDLLHTLLFDSDATNWFEKPNRQQIQMAKEYNVSSIFVATHSGLTRWFNFPNAQNLFEDDANFKAIDEDWYRRAVEENFYNNELDSFIYAAPFEISGYEENLITSTNAIFLNNGSSRTPVAVVGFQFDRMKLLKLYENVIKDCGDEKCGRINCVTLDCYILDNNAYVVIADSADTGDEFDIEFTGRFFGDLRPDIMYHLVNDGVFKETKMFDYQAICYNPPQEPSSAFTIKNFIHNFLSVFNGILSTVLILIETVFSKPDYLSKREDTLTFQNLSLEKTYPTPCDHQMMLFTLNEFFNASKYTNKTSLIDCDWQYVVQRIPNSNLLFMALNRGCVEDTVKSYDQTPTPIEIYYPDELPCHIAKNNNYYRKSYINCFNRSAEEDALYKEEGPHCGRTWSL